MFDQFIYWHSTLLNPDRALPAIAAMILVLAGGSLTGPARGWAAPFLWIVGNGTLGALGGRLDRVERSGGVLAFLGLVLTVGGLILAFLAGLGAERLSVAVPLRGALEVLFLALLLASGTVFVALGRLLAALHHKDGIKGAYYTIAKSTRTDMSGSDDYGITRSGMVFAARSYDKAMVAPVFWYLIAGLPGAFLYSMAAFMAWRFGKEGFTKGFGSISLHLERLMGIVPSMYAGVLMALAGLFTPTGGMTRAFHGFFAARGRAPYFEGGWPVTAMAWSLNVTLGGPARDIDGSALAKAWAGPENATARLEAGHLRRAGYITFMAHLLFIASLLGVLVVSGRIFS